MAHIVRNDPGITCPPVAGGNCLACQGGADGDDGLAVGTHVMSQAEAAHRWRVDMPTVDQDPADPETQR